VWEIFLPFIDFDMKSCISEENSKMKSTRRTHWLT